MNKTDRLLLLMPNWLLTIAVVTAVMYLTLMPDPVPEVEIELFPGIDKVVHAVMMMGVFLCIAIDVIRHDHKTLHRLTVLACAIIFIITTLFGGCIELLQASMNMGRGCELSDFWADMVGAFVGWIIVQLSPWPR